jgi:protein SCO1/2
MRNGLYSSLIVVLLASGAQADVPPPPAVQQVSVTEKLGQPIPQGLSFVDSNGKRFQLKDVLAGGKPVLLTLVYYDCPMLCSLVMGGTVSALTKSGLKLGQDYRALTVSVDPNETSDLARTKKRGYLQSLGYPETDPNWVFATGDKPEIDELADAVGFGYQYDGASKQYAHDAVIMFLSPEGKMMRYLYGVTFQPQDVKLALVEASHGKVGTSLDRVLLTCFQYDPATHRYGLFISLFVRIGATLVLLSLITLLFILFRYDKKMKRGSPA